MKTYIKKDLETMTISQIKDVMNQLGYKYSNSLTKGLLITKFLEQQDESVNDESIDVKVEIKEEASITESKAEDVKIVAGQIDQTGNNPQYQKQAAPNQENVNGYEQSKPIQPKNKTEHDSLGKAGAIINIISASLWLIWDIILILVIIGIFMLVFHIFVIVSNVNYLKGKNNKTTAGVLGIFVSLIGGIFVLVSK